jgi:hypothetical protein
MKYRCNAEANDIQIFTSTVNASETGTDSYTIPDQLFIRDGEWHIIVLDLARVCRSFKKNENGEFIAKYLRLDVFNFAEGALTPEHFVDIAYIGITTELETAVMLDDSTGEVLVFSGKGLTTYDPTTGEQK